MNTDQKSFIVFKDSVEEVQMLSMEQRGLLITTALCYVNELELPELDQATAILWQTWKKNIDRNAVSWEETRQRRAEAGRKGGLAAHRQGKAGTSIAEQNSPRQAVTVTDTVTGTVTGTDTVTVFDEGSPHASQNDAFHSNSTSFPLKNGSKYVVSDEEVQHYVRNYPTVDVPRAFQEMLSWMNNNPNKLKTEDYIPKFITYWLDNAAKKAMRKEANTHAGNAEAADLSALDSFGTVL